MLARVSFQFPVTVLLLLNVIVSFGMAYGVDSKSNVDTREDGQFNLESSVLSGV